MTPRVALTIAGSDSGGGAGLQADLRTFAAWGVHGTVAVTAVTAQSTVAVTGVLTIDPAFVTLQVRTVLADLDVAAVKTGMLARPDTVAAVADLAAEGCLVNLVVDPVLVSSTGHPLMDEGGVDAYRRLLIPRALVVTPNLRETAVLTGRPLADLGRIEAMVEAAEEIRGLGAVVVVIKGGHFGPPGVARRRGRARGGRGARGRAGRDGQRPRHRVLAVGGHRRPAGPGHRPRPRRGPGQGLRPPGSGGVGRLAAGRRPRAHRPPGLGPSAPRSGARPRPRARRGVAVG